MLLFWCADADKDNWQVTQDAMTDIGLSCREQNEIFQVLTAILHLGNIAFCYSEDEDATVVNEQDRKSG